MTMHIRKLTKEERELLQAWSQIELEEPSNARFRQRAKMILLASKGWTVPQIAEELGTRQETVRFWLKRFLRDSAEGLKDKQRGGRPPRVTPETKGLIIDVARRSPRSLGLEFEIWSYNRLAIYLKEEHGINLKKTRIHEIMESAPKHRFFWLRQR